VWVQSQTTFAALCTDEEGGGFEVKVLKQKIWVDGVSYELQEIYGMEQVRGDGLPRV
jgi:E3 ubiquitin-protein ligase MGRN1